jgi:TPR repeat protein
MYTFNTQILTNLNTVKENEKYYSILRTAHPEVQFNLGQMYYYGKNILKNEVKAEELFRSAANQGHIGAQIELGNLNHYMANLYLQLGTEIFNNINTVNDIDLSNIYFSSAEIHDIEAVHWYQLVASRNDPRGQFNLGLMYKYGRGVTIDYNKAILCFQEAARKGHLNSHFELNFLLSKTMA